ncbi:hypothetical protein CF336_g1299 [Tilletia laevis]|nr:hypothetical protein CF336_g1299 [Tilletia laevis]
MRFSRSLAVFSALLTSAALAAPSYRLSPGLPSEDPFYKPPFGWCARKNGAILRTRQVTPSKENVKAAYQMHLDIPPQSPAKIISLQLPEDSASIDCAPSSALIRDSTSAFASQMPAEDLGLDQSLKNGYYVNIPDHEGSRALVFIGPAEGHAVLDSLKAVTRFPTAIPGVNRRTPIVLGGYSGGAHATSWASSFHPTYAASLNILGQVIGGTPVNTSRTSYFLNRYNAYPDVKRWLDKMAYPNGTALLQEIQQSSNCLMQVVIRYAYRDTYTYFKEGVFEGAAVRQRLAENYLGSDGSTLKVKTIMYHSDTDDVIPVVDAKNYAKDQCAKGASVKFILDTDRSHTEEHFARADDFAMWMDSFHKGTADASCVQ